MRVAFANLCFFVAISPLSEFVLRPLPNFFTKVELVQSTRFSAAARAGAGAAPAEDGTPRRVPLPLRHARGVVPKTARKAALKCCEELKP